ncbi:MAG TPA: CSLREA domain-containing protein, partial [Xanthomonadales bacterium]|nr:CSLREA domain-containing protein [Xanthomonadales bacterium]
MSLRVAGSFALLLSMLFATSARAQPANDAWANRTVVAALPFSASQPQAGTATNDPTDPDPPCRSVSSNPLLFSIWFGFTTGAQPVYLDGAIGGSDLAAVIAVYTGSPGSFRIVSAACGRRGQGPGFPPRFGGVRLAPNTSYSILVGSLFPVAPDTPFTVTLAPSTIRQVTKTTDTNDGACDGDCSLREAISAAASTGGAVLLPSGMYVLSVAGGGDDANATGDLDVAPFTGIYGAGAGVTILQSVTGDRVLDLAPSSFGRPDYGNFAIADLTIRGGNAYGQ